MAIEGLRAAVSGLHDRLGLPSGVARVLPRKLRSRFSLWLIVTFLLCVLTPALLVGVYSLFWKTPTYMSEARLAVQSADRGSDVAASGLSSIMKKIGGGAAIFDRGDIFGVRDYVLSRDIILSLGGPKRLVEIFGKSNVDPLSRLESDASIEDAWEYWQGKVTAYADTSSNILILRVNAFDPADAKSLLEEIAANSEKLINEITLKQRAQTLAMADEQVRRSSEAVAEARTQLLNFQQQTGVIEPIETVSHIAELIGKLDMEKIDLEIDLGTRDKSGLRNDSKRNEIELKIEALSAQIADLENKLVGAQRSDSMLSILRQFELLKLNEEFQTQLYTINRNSYEQARRALEEQQKFLIVIVKPVLPQEPANWHPLRDALLTLFGALVLWGIAALIVGAILDE